MNLPGALIVTVYCGLLASGLWVFREQLIRAWDRSNGSSWRWDFTHGDGRLAWKTAMAILGFGEAILVVAVVVTRVI